MDLLGSASTTDEGALVRQTRRRNIERLPSFYSPALHIAANGVVLGAAAAVTVWWTVRLDAAGAITMLLLAPAFVGFAVVEYAVHRWLLHRRRPLAPLYRGHSLEHHGYFTSRFMHMESSIDLNRVLFRLEDIVGAVVVLILGPAACAATFAPSLGAAWATAGLLYYVTYEVLHFAAHSNNPRWQRVRLLRPVIAHHRQHHAWSIRDGANFALVLPWLDILFRSDARSRARRAALRSHVAPSEASDEARTGHTRFRRRRSL